MVETAVSFNNHFLKNLISICYILNLSFLLLRFTLTKYDGKSRCGPGRRGRQIRVGLLPTDAGGLGELL